MDKDRLQNIIDMLMQINKRASEASGALKDYTWGALQVTTTEISVRITSGGNDVTFVHPVRKHSYILPTDRKDPGLLQAEEYLRGLTEMREEQTA